MMQKMEVKEFYDRHNFPGHYAPDDVSSYLGQNRFIKQIDKYIPASKRVLDAGCGTGFISNYFAFKYPQSHFYGVDFYYWTALVFFHMNFSPARPSVYRLKKKPVLIFWIRYGVVK